MGVLNIFEGVMIMLRGIDMTRYGLTFLYVSANIAVEGVCMCVV